MALRIASAVVGLPLLLLVVWIGSPWFSILVAFAAAIAALEISSISRRRGENFNALVIVLLSVLMIAGAHVLAESSQSLTVIPPIVAIGTLASLVWLLWRGRRLTSWITPVAATLYAGGFLFHAPLLRSLEQGREWVIFLLLVTFATDTAAYFVGRMIGRTPLVPAISPSKTWEGAVGGVVGALGTGIAARYVLGLDTAVGDALLLGGLVGIVGQLGDLSESRLKRIAGVKDSGWLVPGHGGILDRLDSIVFNLLVVYYFVSWAIQRKGLLF